MQHRKVKALQALNYRSLDRELPMYEALINDGIITTECGEYHMFVYACDCPIGHKRNTDKDTIYAIGAIDTYAKPIEEFSWVTEEQWLKMQEKYDFDIRAVLNSIVLSVFYVYKYFGAEPAFGEPIHLATVGE